MQKASFSPGNFSTGMCASYVVQLVIMVYNACSGAAGLGASRRCCRRLFSIVARN